MSVTEKIINATLQITLDEGIKMVSIDRVSEVSGLNVEKITESYPTVESLVGITYRHVFEKLIGVLSLPEHEWTKGRFFQNGEMVWRAMVRFMLDNPMLGEFYYECRQSKYAPVAMKVEIDSYDVYGAEYAKLESAFIENIPDPIDQTVFFVFVDDCTGVFVRHMLHGRLEASMENIDRVWNALQPSFKALVSNKHAQKVSDAE